MYYITVRQSPRYHQMTLDELLFGDLTELPPVISNEANTRTYEVKEISDKILSRVNIPALITTLKSFNATYAPVRALPRNQLYSNFYIAKHDGGFSALFQSLFKTQNKWIDCNAKAVCAGVSQRLNPLIRNHPAVCHDTLFEDTKRSVLGYLSENGFDVSRIDFGTILSSAFRKIDAPVPQLKLALTHLKAIFEQNFGALYHTSAFAYAKKRSILDALRRHQAYQSRWFAKLDLKNFFGCTTPEFVLSMLGKIFPFCEVLKDEEGRRELETALDLGFLNGGLPQGTPLSPMLTNLMMIPFGYKVSNAIRDFEKQHYVYTRYADDFQISSRYSFSSKKIENLIVETLKQFGAPFTINSKKTRYGSNAGKNWSLGMMLNKDNNITLGWRERRRLTAAISSYVLDRKNNKPWDLSAVQSLNGRIGYHRHIEGRESVDGLVGHLSKKFGVDIMKLIKKDLAA